MWLTTILFCGTNKMPGEPTECLNFNDCINDLQKRSILASRISDTDGHGVGVDVMIDLMLLI